MDNLPAFTPKDLIPYIVAAVAKAVSNRDGEPREQFLIRIQAATHTVLAFSPRDPIEAMLAGQCFMLHEMIVDNVHKSFSGEEEGRRRPTRAGIVSMDKQFGANLDRLERYQARRAQASDTRPMDGVAETDIADRARRHQAQHAPHQPQAAAQIGRKPGYTPTAEEIVACAANPEAMAALDAADPARFARAMGLDNPSEAYLAAAGAQMTELNRQAARSQPGPHTGTQTGSHQQAHPVPHAGNRQARRHPNR